MARQLAERASTTAAEFFQLCARALDYCSPVDITFGDFLRALITANLDLKDEEGSDVRDALMQAFRVRGIFPENAAFFSQDSLCWPRVPKWDPDNPAKGALPPVEAMFTDPQTGEKKLTELVFGDPNGLTSEEGDINGRVLRKYVEENAAILGFWKSDGTADGTGPVKAGNPVTCPCAALTSYKHLLLFSGVASGDWPELWVSDGTLTGTRMLQRGLECLTPGPCGLFGAPFPFRAGVTLIISAPEITVDPKTNKRVRGKAVVRYAIGKPMEDADGARQEAQRQHNLAIGLANGNTDDPNHFQVNFGLLHQGL